MLQSLTVFWIVSTLHFLLSVTGILFILPAAFETQGGAGFWAAPGKAILAWLPNVLLAPLAWATPPLPVRSEFGYLDIAVISTLFGLAAVGIHYAWRKKWRT